MKDVTRAEYLNSRNLTSLHTTAYLMWKSRGGGAEVHCASPTRGCLDPTKLGSIELPSQR